MERKIFKGNQFKKVIEEAGTSKDLKTYNKVFLVAEQIKKDGGKAYLVGGAVRDLMLGIVPKDYDLEVFKLTFENTKQSISKLGNISEVGKSFGILKLNFSDGASLDIALPRKELKIASGHKGFDVQFEPDLDPRTAASRRDFTINSMAYDPLTQEVFDPFNSQSDLKKGILRITNPIAFKEDPLRVLRALQFISRFELTLDPESEEQIKEMIPYLKELPGERIFEEWKKLLLRSNHPSLGLAVGMELGVLNALHPEFSILVETPQEPKWHPEGDVWKHTLRCLDEAVRIVRREKLGESDALPIMLAVLCHDLGKPVTTEKKEGKIISHGHEEAGEAPARTFLEAIRCDNLTTEKVISLVTNHLAPTHLYNAVTQKGQKVGDGAIRRLAKRIEPASILELTYVAEADAMGSGPFVEPKHPFDISLIKEHEAGEWLLMRAKEIEVEKKGPENLIEGKDLLGLGLPPGPDFGKIIYLANELRDDINFTREDFFRVSKGKDIDEIIAELKKLFIK